jgi:hypothetical protein
MEFLAPTVEGHAGALSPRPWDTCSKVIAPATILDSNSLSNPFAIGAGGMNCAEVTFGWNFPIHFHSI